MARSVKAKIKPLSKLAGAHRLLGYSLRFYHSHWRLLVPIMIVALVINLLIGWVNTSEVASTYQGLWFGFTSCALVWGIRHAGAKVPPRLAQAYWTGTGPVLKYFVVLSVLALASLPFLIGAVVLNYLVYQAATDTLLLIIGGVICGLLGLVSLVLLSRQVFALVITTLPDLPPLKALRTSWLLSRGRTWRLVARLAVLLVYLMLVAIIITLGLGLVGVPPNWLNYLNSGLTYLLFLPVFYIYVYLLYKDLV